MSSERAGNASEAASSARRSRGRRWRRRVGVTALLMLAVGVLAGWWLLRPHRLAGIVERVLASRMDAAVQVERASLSWDGRLVLKGVDLDVPTAAKQTQRPRTTKRATELLSAAAIELQLSPWAALWGDFEPRHIHLRRPTLYITQDLENREFNLERLPSRPGDQPLIRPGLPSIVVDEAHVQLGEIVDGRYQARGRLRFEGGLNRAGEQRGRYHISLRQLAPVRKRAATQPLTTTRAGSAESADPPPTTITGRLDTREHAAELTLHRFRFQGPQRNLLPARIRQWWDRLDPAGALPTVKARFAPGADGKLRLTRARLEMKGLALSMPLERVTPNEAPRMRDVSGRFTLDGDQIRIRELTGRIEGIRYHVTGRVRGFGPDAPFTLDLRTEPFTVPAEPPYLPALPPVVREQYDHFDPKGRFRADVRLTRRKPGGTIHHEGRVKVIDATLRYHKFPYPVQNLRGTLRFDNDKVVADMRGRGPGGGELKVDGLRIAPPRDGGGSNLTLEARNVPIDAALLNAMKPEHREAMKLFFSRSGQRQLIKRGAIEPGAMRRDGGQPRERPARETNRPGAATRPASVGGFSLGGKLPYIRIRSHRPVGDDQDLVLATTIHTRGLRGVFEHWPYPMVSTGGAITIRRGRVDVDRLTLKSPAGGRAVIDGYVETPTDDGDGEVVPHLRIERFRLPVDRLLRASLPEPQNRWLRQANLEGTITGTGRIYRRDDGEIDFTLNANLRKAGARPFGGDYRFDDITARFTMNRSGVRFKRLTASRDDSELAATGRVDWAEGDVAVDLSGRGESIAWEPALLDLLPSEHPLRQKLATLHQRHDPAGLFDASFQLERAPASESIDYTLTLRPRETAFNFRGERIELSDMSGAVHVTPDTLEFDDLSAAYPQGKLTVSGPVAPAKGEATLTFTGEGDRLGSTLRPLLPAAIRRAVERMQFEGGFEVTDGRLNIDKAGAYRVEADLKLKHASARLHAPIENLTGTIDLTARRPAGRDWPRLRMRVRAESMRLWNRSIGPVALDLASADDNPALLRIESVRGRVLGGRVVGRGAVHLDSRAYRAELSLHDVGVEALLRQTAREPGGQGTKASATQRSRLPRGASTRPAATRASGSGRGRLTARLSLAREAGENAIVRGRGALQVRDASLYDQPVMLALLQTANLSLPVSRSFDRVAARFMLHGSDVRFNLLRFESPNLAIAGRGSMALPSRKLDLTMFCRNPARLELGPVSDAINVFKDELLCVRVSGTLMEPEAQPVSFQGLRHTWQAVMEGEGLPRHANEPRPMPFRP